MKNTVLTVSIILTLRHGAVFAQTTEFTYQGSLKNGDVGVGANNPDTKHQVTSGSVFITNPNSLITTSPNGACWFISVSNAGALTTVSVPCP